MDNHSGMYFTMWYGVYNLKSRLLTYASGGHPPALLMEDEPGKPTETRELRTPNLFVGGLEGREFQCGEVEIRRAARLYVFSDGVYEVANENGVLWGINGLRGYLEEAGDWHMSTMDDLYSHVHRMAGSETLEDDFSVLEKGYPDETAALFLPRTSLPERSYTDRH